DGVLSQISAEEGTDVAPGDVLGVIETDGSATTSAGENGKSAAPASTPEKPASPPAAPERTQPSTGESRATPVAQRMAAEHNVDLTQVSPSAAGSKITKEDVQQYVNQRDTAAPARPQQQPTQSAAKPAPAPPPAPTANGRREERTKMSRRRQTIARRLVEAQSTAAMLTTFNEIDMKAVMDLRSRRKEAFKEKFGVSLGLSSFFVKATIGALKAFPTLNAEIQEREIVIKHYYDIGIAIGAEEGLVVPVLRDADRLSFAEIESQIREFARQSNEGSLSIESLTGGTFTITNGGVFGSMMSTPILNPPQVGILGLHSITDRPVVVDGEIVIRPMMYAALTYDHRIVDGREAVQFLVRVKNLIEDPETLLIEG
ncbi:MAG: 2-oxoglutarate dehydrogenase complex dihydrolipoyllysine-residue succinyltransferase, partial [Chloroflexota bacterium]